MHKSDKHIPALDGIRGMAVLLVIFYHTGGGAQSKHPLVHAIGTINKYGWTGVTLFFVLSGFLITGILWDTRYDPHHLKNFYARRSLRIFPLYYLALFLAVVGSIRPGLFRECMSRLWVYVLYLQNVDAFGLHASSLPSDMVTLHFWSLAVEEQFYLLWPALVLRTRSLNQARNLCIGVFAVSTAAKIVYAVIAGAPNPLNDSLWANAGGLALGGYIAVSVRQRVNLRVFAPYVMGTALGVFIAGSAFGSMRIKTMLDLTMASLFWGGMLVLSLQPGFVQRVFKARWLRWIGSISYGMYIYHWLFRTYYESISLKIYPHASESAHQGLRFLVTFILTLGISWLSFNYFERPISKLKRHFHSRTPVNV